MPFFWFWVPSIDVLHYKENSASLITTIVINLCNVLYFILKWKWTDTVSTRCMTTYAN